MNDPNPYPKTGTPPMANRSSHPLLPGLCAFALAVIAACGGGSGGSSSSSSSSSSGGTVANTAPVIVDAGPGGIGAANTLYTTVKICAHGSTTNCQTIDHIQVDTASVGFRVLAPVLTVTGLTPLTDASGNAYVECTQFADGYSWGPVVAVDLTIAGLTATSLPIQVIGEQTYANSVPASCSSGFPPENTVSAFGANGILGISFFPQDCGAYCASSSFVQSANYYTCTTALACTPSVINLNTQVQNPVPLFSTNNNGVALKMPAVSAPGATTVAGTLFFGIATQSNNKLPGGQALYAVQDTTGSLPGTLATNYNGAMYTTVIDSGSNAYYFPDASIAPCGAANLTGFYCPQQTPLPLVGQIVGEGKSPNSATIDFQIGNAGLLLGNGDYALPGLAATAPTTDPIPFGWGLPFFYGRTVFFAFDGAAVSNASNGPWIAF